MGARRCRSIATAYKKWLVLSDGGKQAEVRAGTRAAHNDAKLRNSLAPERLGEAAGRVGAHAADWDLGRTYGSVKRKHAK